MTLWVVRCGGDSAYELEAYDKKIVGIGWGKLGDLSKFKTIEELRTYYGKVHSEEKLGAIRTNVAQVFSFLSRMQIGDLVALPIRSSASIAFGRITGNYQYSPDAHTYVKHQRAVEWIGSPIPRSQFDQDLLFTFGAFLTVFRAQRNDAENRILSMLGKPIATPSASLAPATNEDETLEENVPFNIEGFAQDQLRNYITRKFAGHDLAKLVGEILRAEGYSVMISPEGPDGGVDVLAGGGKTGFEPPLIAVQVKSGAGVTDAPTLRQLQGAMNDFNATHGLFVSWGGFNAGALKASRKTFFSVQLWDSDELIQHLTSCYDNLSDEMKALIPLKRIWALMPESE
jgi:restriction system protein